MVLNFDSNKNAIINAKDFVKPIKGMPQTVITFFENKLLDEFLRMFKTEIIGETGTACKRHPVYKFNYKGKDLAVVQSGVGAPYAVGNFEEVVAMGAKNILMFGSCGVLVDAKEASIIVPTAAIRGEGTSYHYARPSEEIALQPKYVNRLIKFFKNANVDYITGKTWTCDAIFRETPKKMKQRLKQGCVSVEMECAAMAAFAKFRKINFAEFFYAADSLASKEWDARILLENNKLNGEERALILAIECALTLFD